MRAAVKWFNREYIQVTFPFWFSDMLNIGLQRYKIILFVFNTMTAKIIKLQMRHPGLRSGVS